MKKLILILFTIILCRRLQAQPSSANLFQKLMPASNWVQAKNYYLLTLFKQDKSINHLLSNNVMLTRLAQKK